MDAKRAWGVMTAAGAFVLAMTAAAGAAPGDTVLQGETSEAVTVKLTVAESGNATAFRIGRAEVGCGHGTVAYRATAYKPLDTSDPGEFSDRTKSSSDNGGYHFRTKTVIRGAVADDNESWTGTFKLVSKVFKHGSHIDTCRLKTLWSAAP